MTLSPLRLHVEVVAAMLNLELADHPVYDGLELQWFDDPHHGTGMLAFLSRRADRVVDYHVDPALRLDPRRYRLGAGTGSWTATRFDVARLRVHDDGVEAEVRFRDGAGRLVELRVDDRDGRRRRRAGLLAPVGAAVADPASLMLVWMPAFDLVRATGTAPLVRIDGEVAAVGRLPGARLHRRHLVKYAAPLVVVHVNGDDDGVPVEADSSMRVVRSPGGDRTAGLAASTGGHDARLVLDPGLPDVALLADGADEVGTWHVSADGTRLTGGGWRAARTNERVDVAMTVTQRWRPRRLPLLMRVVTTVMPVFRRWPTTYRWRASTEVGTGRWTSGWERSGTELADAYRRATTP